MTWCVLLASGAVMVVVVIMAVVVGMITAMVVTGSWAVGASLEMVVLVRCYLPSPRSAGDTPWHWRA